MNALRLLFALTVCSISAVPTSASTLTYFSADAGRQLTLRRDDAQLVLVDDCSRAVVADALAAETQHVFVRGASGSQNDTLTVDLSQPFSLAGGIDYDGGSAGWDTLVVSGGSVRTETVTQLTPHDGIFDLDGLVIRYTNLEPITDTVAALNFFVNGTAGTDTVTISDGPGAGEATISSPTFESVTFANKTNVTFDGQGGGDSFTISNATPPTGLTSFIIQDVATVTNTVSFTYPSFGVSATGTVDLDDIANNVTNLEIHTQNGAIEYRDVDSVIIGGVSASLSGLHVTTNGSVLLHASGLMSLADTDGPDIISAGVSGGDVAMQSFGIGSDIEVTVDNEAITAMAGAISLVSGGHILLGQAGALYSNDIRASGSLQLNALFDIRISGNTNVVADAFGNNTGGQAAATAGVDFLLSDSTGPGATFGTAGTAGGDTTVLAQAGTVSVTADSASALFSQSGYVFVVANRLILASGSGIDAPLDSVFLVSSTVPIDLGSATDAAAALEISDAEVDRVNSPNLTVRTGAGVDLTVTQPITFGGSLSLLSSAFTSAGTGSLNAPSLLFEATGPAVARTWTIDASDITISPGAAIPYSGVATLSVDGGSGNDVFNVTPSASTTFDIEGNSPAPPSLPGDTLDVDTTGTTSPFLSYTAPPSGFAGSYTFGNRAAVNFIEIETLDAETDLAVTKTDGALEETPGTTVTYTIVASNPGSLGVSGATVVDTFPPELSDINWTCTASPGSACNPGGSGGLNQLVNLAAGGTATFLVTATISNSASGLLSNTVTVSTPAGTTDPNGANNTATDVDTLVAEADLSVSKTTVQTTYVPGGTITYTIVLENDGPSDATNAELSDPLPANTTFASLTAPGGYTCATPAVGANGTVTCTAATVLSGASDTFTLVVNIAPAATGSIANTASVSATSADANGANDDSTAALSAAALIPIPALSAQALMLLAALIGVVAIVMLKRFS